MDKLNPIRQQIEREKALFLYCNALERGDADTMARVLQQATADEALERMILAAHAVEVAAEDAREEQWATAQVQHMLAQHLPSGQAVATKAEVGAELSEELSGALPPVTVADVAARMEVDAAQLARPKARTAQAATGAPANADESRWAERLRGLRVPLPDKLNGRGLQRFFESLGVPASPRFQNSFRETALFLLMGRQQGMAQLAATRRQRGERQGRRQKAAEDAPQEATE